MNPFDHMQVFLFRDVCPTLASTPVKLSNGIRRTITSYFNLHPLGLCPLLDQVYESGQEDTFYMNVSYDRTLYMFEVKLLQ
jgi:hypothetical protein